MTTLSPFNSTTAALFGQPASAVRTDAATALKAAALKSAALKAAEAEAALLRANTPHTTAQGGNDSFDVYKNPEFLKDPAAAIAKSEAAMENWEANEQKFQADNGFRREANSMILGMYAHAKTGHFGTAAINTRKDMNDLFDRFFSGFQSDVAFINKSGGRLTVSDTYAGPIDKGLDARATVAFQAERQDHLDARRMTLYAETAYVAKSLGLSQPVVTEQNGKVSFTEQDITFQGKPFARIDAGGNLTLLAANPDPAHPDPVDLYLPLDQRL